MLGNVTACKAMMLRVRPIVVVKTSTLRLPSTTVKCHEARYARELLGGNGILLENHIGRFRRRR